MVQERTKFECKFFDPIPGRLVWIHIHKWSKLCSGARNLINDEGFRNALYLIDVGQNDLADSFSKNLSYMQVIKKIPAIITEIEKAIKSLYNQGARKFWVHNTGPWAVFLKYFHWLKPRIWIHLDVSLVITLLQDCLMKRCIICVRN